MTECTLMEILNAREERVKRREALIKKSGCPVLSMTMNIPGAVKDGPLIRRTFHAWLDLLWTALEKSGASDAEIRYEKTGPELLWALDIPARELKRHCIDLEETDPAGRLADLDVYDEKGHAVSRTELGFQERPCILCGAPGRACAAGQMHPLSEVRAEAERRMRAFFSRKDPAHFAELAVSSLIMEARTTPKPGLVDGRNSGSHKDMDLRLMIRSAEALGPYFEACIRAGMDSVKKAPEETFPLLRKLGLEAEKTMFSVTDGVNTHKGAVYLFGILLGAFGRLWQADRFPEPEKMLLEGGKIASASVEEDLRTIGSLPDNALTSGQRIYRDYGLRGARGEAADGFPSVRLTALPYLRAHREEGRYQSVLLHLIALGKDTNLIARCGFTDAKEAVEKVRALLSAGEPGLSALEELDDWFIRKNLSPGGSADLLAVSIFCMLLERASEKEFG